MSTFQRFEDIEAWQLGRQLTREVYAITRSRTFSQDFALRDQIRRAAISVTSNIAEGFERRSPREFLHFLSIAKGSAGEVRSQLYVALDERYVDPDHFARLQELCEATASKTGGLMAYLRRHTRPPQPVTRNP